MDIRHDPGSVVPLPQATQPVSAEDPGSGNARVLLLTSGLGYGHVRAAQAAAAALLQQCATVKTFDLWSLMNPGVAGIVQQTYLRLVQQHPQLYERLYHLDERTWREILESEQGPPAPVLEVLELISVIAGSVATSETASLRYTSDRLLLALLCTTLPYDGASLGGNGVRARLALMKWTWMRLVKRLEAVIHHFHPDVIVCTQMIPAAMVSALKRRHRVQVPVVGVLTDFGVHDFWRQPGIDRYCVADASLQSAFAMADRKEEAVATGVPLMPGFALPLSQEDARRQIGVAPREPMVLVLGGGLGLSVESTTRSLLRSRSKFKIVVMPGRNVAAQATLAAAAARSSGRLQVCEWTERMDIFIRAADVIVGKPGGITVAEVLACARTLFATRSLGGQEGFNVRFLERHGVGALIPDEELLERVEALVTQPTRLLEMQRRARALGHPQGAQRVAQMVTELAWQHRRQSVREH